MLKVAFIDDGIMDGINEVPKMIKRYMINESIEIKERGEAEKFYLSHATMCWWIFYEHLESKDICLYDIQILDPVTQSTNLSKLLKALHFCLEEEVNVINMSLGTTDLLNLVSDNILERLHEKGTIMVAAKNNNNLITYPACSPFVVGVMCDYIGELDKNEFCMISTEIGNTDVISHCDFNDIEKKYGIVLKKANSFATPFITATLCNAIVSEGSVQDLGKYLEEKSVSHKEICRIEYIKNSFPEWQNTIDVPIILCKDERIIKNLVDEFRNRGYNCVGLLKGEISHYCPYLWGRELYKTYYNFSEKEIELLVYNSTYPDLMMVHCDGKEMGDEREYDVVLYEEEICEEKQGVSYRKPIDYGILAGKIEDLFA
ncbi:hypothetical protein E5329_22735 [Petralouisia muris]|uniref:Uncharacterized protein n=1 Tax=Petralouisia muris TaxID=3032872 RepID=A0AC61RQT5_9FIRM|nr:hypothetical protein [Petralouisia muris]TGY91105.1 hypothetical protein E5329_22735 [Petralouisia muris]